MQTSVQELLLSTEPENLAKKADLRYISETEEGFFRQRVGQSWKYYDLDGQLVRDPAVKERINSLRIPPAWERVWICPRDNGHLQAVGVDTKGRKQYIYHQEWVRVSQEKKFDRLVPFAQVLPKIRRRVQRDLEAPGLPRQKVLGAAVWILEHTLIRVGNDEYAKENSHYGLTTLRNRHVRFIGSDVRFEFVGKSGVKHSLLISDPRVIRIIRRCVELPGYELLQFVDDGQRQRVDSGDVNDYLQEVTGVEITAKEFRTWGGTVLAALTLAKLGPAETATAAKRVISGCVKSVAGHLGNKPAICRSHYIHPTVISSYEQGLLVPHFERGRAEMIKRPAELSLNEAIVIDLLKKYS